MAPARVRIVLPAALRAYWNAPTSEALIAGATLAEAILQLSAQHPGLAARILDDQGRVRQHVHVFLNGVSVGHEDPTTVALGEGDVVRVLPAVSGGT